MLFAPPRRFPHRDPAALRCDPAVRSRPPNRPPGTQHRPATNVGTTRSECERGECVQSQSCGGCRSNAGETKSWTGAGGGGSGRCPVGGLAGRADQCPKLYRCFGLRQITASTISTSGPRHKFPGSSRTRIAIGFHSASPYTGPRAGRPIARRPGALRSAGAHRRYSRNGPHGRNHFSASQMRDARNFVCDV